MVLVLAQSDDFKPHLLQKGKFRACEGQIQVVHACQE